MKRALALAGLVVAGCMPELVQIEGEHILYEHSAEFEVCGGTVAHLDGLVPWLSEHMGIATPDQIRYSWISRADLEKLLGKVAREIVAKHADGVAIGDHAMSFSEPAHTHELVHSLWGEQWSAPFLIEGVATAHQILIDGWFVPYDAAWDWDVWEQLTASYPDVDYAAAGVFVLFLLARHGPEKFARFYRAVRRPYTRGEMGAEFREAYGVELADEIDHFGTGDLACEDFGYDLLAVRCFGPEIAWTEGFWSFSGILACDGADVVGGITPQGRAPSDRVVTVDVPQDGDYEVLLYGDSGISATLLPCFGCPLDGGNVYPDLGLAANYTLRAGRYQVRVTSYSDEVLTFGVSLRPVDAP